MSKYSRSDEALLRDAAWIGDAVLSLFLRRYLLSHPNVTAAERVELFKHFSSNQFLNNFGRPTAMEAEIGEIYTHSGLESAFSYIETKYIPTIERRLKNLKRPHQKNTQSIAL